LLDKVGTNVGIDAKILKPAIEGAFKAETAKFQAKDILPQRPKLQAQVIDGIKQRITDGKYDILIKSIEVSELKFSEKYMDAIENKQVAEQEALQAGYLEKKEKAKAKAVIATAEGLAKSQKLQSQTITPMFLKKMQLENQAAAIAKWKGDVPKFTGGQGMVPFMNVDSIK
jgi:regulator of protease activity HflC (stomatin/prohibitin superfamily)